MKRLLLSILLLAIPSLANAGRFCPLELWMEGTYSLYYGDRYTDEDCSEGHQADYYYGLPLPTVPWTDCATHCTADYEGKLTVDKKLAGQSFPGLARPVTPNYQHTLPEGGRGAPTRRHSVVTPAGYMKAVLADESVVCYARVFKLRVKRPEMGMTPEVDQTRFVAMHVFEEDLNRAQRREAEDNEVTVTSIRGGAYAFSGAWGDDEVPLLLLKAR